MIKIFSSLIGSPPRTLEPLVLAPAFAFPSLQIFYHLRDFMGMTPFVSLEEEVLFKGIMQTALKKTSRKPIRLIAAFYLFGIMDLIKHPPPVLASVSFARIPAGLHLQ